MRVPILLALMLTLPLGVLRAQSPTDARVHYEAGKAAFGDGRYKDAIHELQIAYDLDPNPALIYNIARAYEEDLQLDKALTLFRQFADGAGTPEARAAAEARAQQVAELKKKLSLYGVVRGWPGGTYLEALVDGDPVSFDEKQRSLVLPPGMHDLEFRYAGGLKMFVKERLPLGEAIDLREIASRHAVIEVAVTPPDARLMLDGDYLATDRPLTIPAGPHTLTVEATGYEKVVHDVVLAPEARTPVRLDLVSFAQIAEAQATALPSYPLYVGGGTALAGLVTGVTMQVLASKERRHILDGRTMANGAIYDSTQLEARAAEDRARRYLVGAWVGYGVAAAAAVFEVTWTVLYLQSRPAGQAAKAPPVTITVGPGVVGLGGRF
jgi:hypothetical protein